MSQIRFEEYAPVGAILAVSFARDQAGIAVRFPKLDAGFLGLFQGKLAEVKALEGTLKFNEKEKNATASLYEEAGELNIELNYLSAYFVDAGLPTKAITVLKKLLTSDNIEGALLEIKNVKDYVIENKTALEEHGMASGFPDVMEAHRVSLGAKNTLQDSVIYERKSLVEANKSTYKALHDYISSIAKKGKLIFKGTVVEDEYNLTKILARMRSPNKGGNKGGGDLPSPMA